jgi:hypothetical protein
MVSNWAASNELAIINLKRKAFFRGPFTFTSYNSQEVFRIVARDTSGITRSGWARCGSWVAGLLSDQVEVLWDGESNVQGFPVIYPSRNKTL